MRIVCCSGTFIVVSSLRIGLNIIAGIPGAGVELGNRTLVRIVGP